MALRLPNKALNLKAAFTYSALESIGSRIFDFITLWIVLNTLEEQDLAKFGVATASIFIFNFIFFAPETALFKYFNRWKDKGELGCYIASFFQFSAIKLFVHYFVLIIVYFFYSDSWFFYAIIFSIITQNIQFSEIGRIVLRLSLKQNKVAFVELLSKVFLCVACCLLFFNASLKLYFLIYFLWSLTTSIYWFIITRNLINFKSESLINMKGRVIESAVGFSFWTHISGGLTYFVYNGNILFLEFYNSSTSELALFTVINKVANLFFVVPMFFQSFVPVILASKHKPDDKFTKLLLLSTVLAVSQFIFFVLFGNYMGGFFGVADERIEEFYKLGLILCTGILFLNLSRPLSTFLMIRYSSQMIMLLVFIPTTIFAVLFYGVATKLFGALGAAVAACLTYIFMSIALMIVYIFYKKRINND